MSIQEHIATCERHNKHLSWALNKMSEFIPITGASFGNLSEDQIA